MSSKQIYQRMYLFRKQKAGLTIKQALGYSQHRFMIILIAIQIGIFIPPGFALWQVKRHLPPARIYHTHEPRLAWKRVECSMHKRLLKVCLCKLLPLIEVIVRFVCEPRSMTHLIHKLKDEIVWSRLSCKTCERIRRIEILIVQVHEDSTL